MKLGRKTLNIVYVTLFLITITLSLLVIAFSALSAYFNNQTQIYYTAADINNGQTLNQAIKSSTSYQTEDSTVTRVVFDYYTTKEVIEDGEEEILNCTYVVDGVNVIEGVVGSTLLWDTTNVELYRISNAGGGTTVYILSDEDIIASSDMSYAFYTLTACKEIVFNNFQLTDLTTNLVSMFYNCSSLQAVDLTNFDTSNVRNMTALFRGCSSLASLDFSLYPNFDTSSVRDMRSMFEECTSLAYIDVSSFNTSNVTNMWSTSNWDLHGMFAHCSSLTTLDISNFDTSNVRAIGGMFAGCSMLTNLILPDNFGSASTTFAYCFADCSSLETLEFEKLNTSSGLVFNSMFGGCSSLTNIEAEYIDVSNGTSLLNMFSNTAITEIDLSNFNTARATTIAGLFYGCTSLETIIYGDGWDTSNVTDFSSLFRNCSSLNNIDLSVYNFTSAENISRLFDGCSSLLSVKSRCVV